MKNKYKYEILAKDKFTKKRKKKLIKRIKRKKRYTSKIKYHSNIRYKKLIKLFILLLLLFFIFIKKENKIILIKEKNYLPFETIKSKYISDSYLKPILEDINIFNYIHPSNLHKLKKNKINVNICSSINKNYIYQCLVSIESVLRNSNKKKTFITYHIFYDPNLDNNKLEILKSLMNHYSSNLELIFYNMGNNFIKNENERYSKAVFYKLLTPIIINTDRIIFLDGDALTFNDLSEMYQLKFNDNYILGILDFLSDGIDHLGIHSEIYINSGVILLNLDLIRKENKIYKLINYTNDNNFLKNVDQTIINYVFYPKIGILPSKYCIFNFFDKLDIEKYLSLLRMKINITEIEESLISPTVVHHVICWPKIWSPKAKVQDYFSACKKREDCSCEKHHNLWLSYANKTDYYEEILKTS